MKNKLSFYGIIILIILFIGFYFMASLFLENMKHDEEINEENNAVVENDKNYTEEVNIVTNLYNDVRVLYDVVNSKYKVDQEDVIIINDITYKKITNFEEVTDNIFTAEGLNKYINDLGSYFATTQDKYYIAGNLVSYQTYYFRGDDTNVYILDSTSDMIKAIIYEKWTSNNKNTLATIEVVRENNSWLINNISILAVE